MKKKPLRAAPSVSGAGRRARMVRAAGMVAIVALLATLPWADQRGWLLYDGGDMRRFGQHPWRVTAVEAGDLIRVATPDSGQRTTAVRLAGIETPSPGRPRRGKPDLSPGGLAADLTRRLCLGREVKLELDARAVRDGFGCLLATVRLPDGTSLNERLVLGGWARSDQRQQHPASARYDLLEQRARAGGLGLWFRSGAAQAGVADPSPGDIEDGGPEAGDAAPPGDGMEP